MNALCCRCGVAFDREAGAVNRAKKMGAPLYCGTACAGLARRLPTPKTPEQKRAEKSAYDRKRRAEKGEALRVKRMAAYYANHAENLARAKQQRKKRMPYHVEYCRQPEYRAKKHEYDIRRGGEGYADFAEAWRLLLDLEKEIRSQATAYERRVANGYYLRSAQKRRRELWSNRKNSLPRT
jgi:hypothetical protein